MISFTLFSVYAPLSVRLVQNCSNPGWRNVRDVLDLISGPSFEELQRGHTSNLRYFENKIFHITIHFRWHYTYICTEPS